MQSSDVYAFIVAFTALTIGTTRAWSQSTPAGIQSIGEWMRPSHQQFAKKVAADMAFLESNGFRFIGHYELKVLGQAADARGSKYVSLDEPASRKGTIEVFDQFPRVRQKSTIESLQPAAYLEKQGRRIGESADDLQVDSTLYKRNPKGDVTFVVSNVLSPSLGTSDLMTGSYTQYLSRWFPIGDPAHPADQWQSAQDTKEWTGQDLCADVAPAFEQEGKSLISLRRTSNTAHRRSKHLEESITWQVSGDANAIVIRAKSIKFHGLESVSIDFAGWQRFPTGLSSRPFVRLPTRIVERVAMRGDDRSDFVDVLEKSIQIDPTSIRFDAPTLANALAVPKTGERTRLVDGVASRSSSGPGANPFTAETSALFRPLLLVGIAGVALACYWFTRKRRTRFQTTS